MLHRIWKPLWGISVSSDKLRIVSILIFDSKKNLTYSVVGLYFVTENLCSYVLHLPDQVEGFCTWVWPTSDSKPNWGFLALNLVVFVNNFICLRQNPWVKTIIWSIWTWHRQWWVRLTQDSLNTSSIESMVFFFSFSNFVK